MDYLKTKIWPSIAQCVAKGSFNPDEIDQFDYEHFEGCGLIGKQPCDFYMTGLRLAFMARY